MLIDSRSIPRGCAKTRADRGTTKRERAQFIAHGREFFRQTLGKRRVAAENLSESHRLRILQTRATEMEDVGELRRLSVEVRGELSYFRDERSEHRVRCNLQSSRINVIRRLRTVDVVVGMDHVV